MDRASPDPERPRHLQDAHAFRKLLSHLPFGRAIYLRPAELHALGDGALEPCFDRWRIIVHRQRRLLLEHELAPIIVAIALVFLRQGEHPFTAPAIKLTPSIETG